MPRTNAKARAAMAKRKAEGLARQRTIARAVGDKPAKSRKKKSQKQAQPSADDSIEVPEGLIVTDEWKADELPAAPGEEKTPLGHKQPRKKEKKVKLPPMPPFDDKTPIDDEEFTKQLEEAMKETEEAIKAGAKRPRPRKPKCEASKRVHRFLTEESLQTKEELKERLNEHKTTGLLKKAEVAKIISRWTARELRRQKRVNERANKVMCFKCRKPGHVIAECPEANEDVEHGSGICFKCGTTEHHVRDCRVKTAGFPYAKCFVCKRTGHLSKDCEDNPNGIYPKGGSCNLCGATSHLKKDCPQLKPGGGNDRPTVSLSTIGLNAFKSADDEDSNCLDENFDKTLEKKGPKIVKF